MPRFVLTLLAVIFLVADANAAIQLGDSREKITRQYGNPISDDYDAGAATYQWTGWRLDIGFVQGMAQHLVFTRDGASISDAEQRQILNDNGGVASWHPVEKTAAGSKWRRTTDGAEASSSGSSMTLVTKTWAETQALNEFQAARRQRTPNSRIVVTAPTVPANPLESFIAALFHRAMVAVAFIALISFAAFLIRQPTTRSDIDRIALRTPKRLKSACALPPSLPFTSADPAVSTNPKTLADLSWQEFELVIGELYRRQGYKIEMCSGDGSDGGVDLTLRKDGQTTLVQCKHWRVTKWVCPPCVKCSAFSQLNVQTAQFS